MGAPRGRGRRRGLHARAPPAAPGACGGGAGDLCRRVMLSSDDEVEGDGDGGAEGVEVGPEDEEIDVDEWRSAFPNDPDDGTGPDPARGTPYMTRKDWLDLYFDRK